MEIRKIVASAIIYLMAITQATAFGALFPREANAYVPPKKAVRPVLECVEDRGASFSPSSQRYLARFGYQNDNSETVTIAVGNNNKFTPDPINRGQTTTFLPGRRTNTFQVPFNGSNLVWSLRGPDGHTRTSTASSNPAQRCSPTPTPTPTATPTPTPTSTPTPTPTPCVAGTFTLTGSGGNDGDDGNTRIFSANGVTATASAFSFRRSKFRFETAFLGVNSYGLGVTNRGESTGSNDRSRLDNKDGYNEFIAIKFSQPIRVDRAFLDDIGTDSDISVLLTNIPSSAPMNLQQLQQVLGSIVAEGDDGGSIPRWADINAPNSFANVLIIAARVGQSDDELRLKLLEFTCPGTGPVNTPPDAVNDSATVAEDSGSTQINVLGNDTDADGNPLAITAVTQPSGGTVTNNGTNVIFTPGLNFAGTTTFNYTIGDGQGGGDTATVTVIVTPVNDAPVAVNNSYSTNEDTALNVPAPGVLGNDMDVENSPLTAQLVATTSNGTLALLANGGFSYTPNANFSGSDTFTYRAFDGSLPSTPATVTITVNAVNDGPDAVNDSTTIDEDSTNNIISVLANDTDADGGTLAITGVTQPANGNATNNGTNVSYTPNANFSGTDTFTYTVSDGQGGSDTATVTVTVMPAEDAPVAVNDGFATDEDTQLNVPAPGVLSNDSDADGNSLTASLVVGPTNGQLTFLGDGSFLYTPNPNFTGSDSFTYEANDGTVDSNIATVSIAINPVNDGPDAVDDSATTDEDASAVINVLANDTDADGNSLTIQSATNGANGAVINNGTNLTYTPNANFNGTDTFTYTVTDGNGGSDTATVNVTVNPINDAPAAVNDSYTTNEDAALNVAAPGVLSNDTDVDAGTTLTAAVVTGPAAGSLTLNGDGSFSYTPNAGFTGSDSFTYRANDGTTDSDIATVSINVSNENDAPVAVDDNGGSTNEDMDLVISAASLAANDTDPDGDSLTVTAVSNAVNGTVSLAAGSITFTPNANYNGPASFEYTVSDGSLSDTGLVSITVTAVNDVPVAVDDNGGTTDEDTPLNIPSASLLANDTDGGDGGPLSLTAVSPSSANGGTVAIVGANVRYTPALDFAGTDTFTYTLSDGTDTDTATVTVTVTDVPVVQVDLLLNEVEIDPPNATSFACQYAEFRGAPGYVVPAGTSFVSINGTPGNFGDVFFIAGLSGVTVGANGTITVINDVELCPNRTLPAGTTVVTATNFSGFGENAARTFAVINTATLLVEGSDIDTDNNRSIDPNFNITVVDGIALTTNQELEASYAPNIYDASLAGQGIEHPDAATRFIGDTTPLSAAAWYYGELADSPDESTVYQGTPQSANFPSGGRLTPGEQNTLFVANVPPTANDDTATVAEDSGANAIDVLANDTDSDGGTLTVTAATQGANGSVTFTASGVSYTPNPNFAGSDSFTYTISDGQGDFDTATVNVTVTAVNDAPAAQNDSYNATEDTPLNVAAPGVLTNDADVDNASLTAVLVSNVSNGTLVLNANGSFSYTPNDNFSGSDSFTYTANDGAANSNTATVTITVTAVNDAPDAVNDSATVAEDSSNNIINVLANDTDGDGGTLTITGATNGANGSVVNNGTNLSYTPNANYFGTDSFTYTISDGQGGSDTATVSITVTDVPDVALLVNEVEGDAPDSGTQLSCQYVELRGAPGYVVPAGAYFVSINGASASFGDLSFIVDLSGQTVGSNGTITIINELEGTCPGRTFPAGTTLIAVQDFDGLGLLDGGARTFAIITAPTAPQPGDDIDTNEDRVIDPVNGVVVVDGLAFTTNNLFQAAYAPILFEAATQGAPGTILLPDAATRFLADTTPLSAAAWYYGELSAATPNSTTYSGSPQTTPFPGGGALTPGSPNVP